MMFRRILTLPGIAECRGLIFTNLLSKSPRIRWDKASESSLATCSRCYSSGSSEQGQQQPAPGQVFKHERQNMYVCWHPEVPFPYEMTKPIDLTTPMSESNMKIQALTPVREAFRQKHRKLLVQELMKLTYATKHRFFGKFGKKKRLVYREMDPNKKTRNRDYL